MIVGHFEVKINSFTPDLSIKIKGGNVVRTVPMAYFRFMGMVQTGLTCPAYLPFFPDTSHIHNQIVASVHRFGCIMPEPDAITMRHFLAYARMVIHKLTPVRESDIKPWEDWLVGCGYPAGRRDALRALRRRYTSIDDHVLDVKAFIKWESYQCPKNARAILSYTDESKILLGPLVNAIDKATFKGLPYFVKGTDPKTWPEKLRDVFGDMPVNCTDFTSFEAHHRGPYAYIIYYWMAHMIRGLTGRRVLREMIKAMVLGRNVIKFRDIVVQVDQRLMSGALWTSSANSMLNFLIMSYMTIRTRHGPLSPGSMLDKLGEFKGLFEGDDGICEYSPISEELISKMGIKLKMERAISFQQAGFCTILCESESLTTYKDPFRVISKFFALPPKYKDSKRTKVLSYFRAKAQSMKYLFPDAPIIGPMMDWVLRRTKSIDITPALPDLDYWHTYVLQFVRLEDIKKPARVPDGVRASVSSSFGISVMVQHSIEDVLMRCNSDVVPVDLAQFVSPDQWRLVQEFQFERGKGAPPPVGNCPKVIAQIAKGNLKGKGKFSTKTRHEEFLENDRDLMVVNW